MSVRLNAIKNAIAMHTNVGWRILDTVTMDVSGDILIHTLYYRKKRIF